MQGSYKYSIVNVLFLPGAVHSISIFIIVFVNQPASYIYSVQVFPYSYWTIQVSQQYTDSRRHIQLNTQKYMQILIKFFDEETFPVRQLGKYFSYLGRDDSLTFHHLVHLTVKAVNKIGYTLRFKSYEYSKQLLILAEVSLEMFRQGFSVVFPKYECQTSYPRKVAVCRSKVSVK